MINCQNCGSEKIILKGMRRGKQRYKCLDCGKWFSAESKGKELDSDIVEDDKKVGIFDWREWSELLIRRQGLHEKASWSQDIATVKMDTPYRFIVYKPMADMHIGDMGTRYDDLLDFTDKVLKIPYLYLSLSGDETDNFVSFKNQLAVLQQILSPDEQDRFLESWLSEISERILFAGWGNHSSDFEEKVSGKNAVKKILSRNVVYFNGIGVCNIVINGQKYKIASTHKTRFNSAFNKTHGLKQLARRDIPDADIYVSAHTHDPDFEWSPERGLEQWFIVLGSIKANDGYAKRYFSYFSARKDPAVVLDAVQHRAMVFPCLNDALEFAAMGNANVKTEG